MKKTRNIKRKKHDQIVNDYDKIKSKHLEKLANKMLKDEEKRDNLRLKTIKGPKFLHVITTKGKGLLQAEKNPCNYESL